MNATLKKIFIAIGVSLVIGFGVCYFSIVLPAGNRAATELRASNELAKQYKTQIDGSTKTISDMSAIIAGQKSDITSLRNQNEGIRSDYNRLDATNKQLEADKGQLTEQSRFFRDYYNKSQQQDRDFGVAIDTAQGAISSALDDIRTLQKN